MRMLRGIVRGGHKNKIDTTMYLPPLRVTIFKCEGTRSHKGYGI
jgi:hypothetical protein